jgi:hypothetical protein
MAISALTKPEAEALQLEVTNLSVGSRVDFHFSTIAYRLNLALHALDGANAWQLVKLDESGLARINDNESWHLSGTVAKLNALTAYLVATHSMPNPIVLIDSHSGDQHVVDNLEECINKVSLFIGSIALAA